MDFNRIIKLSDSSVWDKDITRGPDANGKYHVKYTLKDPGSFDLPTDKPITKTLEVPKPSLSNSGTSLRPGSSSRPSTTTEPSTTPGPVETTEPVEATESTEIPETDTVSEPELSESENTDASNPHTGITTFAIPAVISTIAMALATKRKNK